MRCVRDTLKICVFNICVCTTRNRIWENQINSHECNRNRTQSKRWLHGFARRTRICITPPTKYWYRNCTRCADRAAWQYICACNGLKGKFCRASIGRGLILVRKMQLSMMTMMMKLRTSEHAGFTWLPTAYLNVLYPMGNIGLAPPRLSECLQSRSACTHAYATRVSSHTTSILLRTHYQGRGARWWWGLMCGVDVVVVVVGVAGSVFDGVCAYRIAIKHCAAHATNTNNLLLRRYHRVVDWIAVSHSPKSVLYVYILYAFRRIKSTNTHTRILVLCTHPK